MDVNSNPLIISGAIALGIGAIKVAEISIKALANKIKNNHNGNGTMYTYKKIKDQTEFQTRTIDLLENIEKNTSKKCWTMLKPTLLK